MSKCDYTVEFGDMSCVYDKEWAEPYDFAYEIETIIKFNDDRPNIKFTMKAGFDDGYSSAFFEEGMRSKYYNWLAEYCWKFEFNNWVSSVYDDVTSIFDWEFLHLNYDMLMRKKLEKTISIDIPDDVRNTYLVYLYYKDEIERSKFKGGIL